MQLLQTARSGAEGRACCISSGSLRFASASFSRRSSKVRTLNETSFWFMRNGLKSHTWPHLRAVLRHLEAELHDVQVLAREKQHVCHHRELAYPQGHVLAEGGSIA